MPYDKGDFTQQGVNGDVSALVRLNEKRVMKVVLSSDDESDNCDISGKVYDMLNGTSYDIGSGVSGNIEITENGENINVAPYATATVNVSGGGGDVIGCNVTVINDADESKSANVSYCYHDNLFGSVNVELDPDETESDLIYFYVDAYEIFNLNGSATLGNITSGSFTNLVNCTLDYEEDDMAYWSIIPVDITQPSSVTISIMAFQVA